MSHFTALRQADTPYLDDPAMGISLVTQLANIINNVLNPTCASNVVSLLCSSFFKECVRVQDESSIGDLWLPSLLCRGACKKHLEVWTQCLVDLESDPAAKHTFDTQMMSLVRRMMSVVCTRLTLIHSCCFRFRAQVRTISASASIFFSIGEILYPHLLCSFDHGIPTFVEAVFVCKQSYQEVRTTHFLLFTCWNVTPLAVSITLETALAR